jgi:anthranilate phosphoribosyltransferase
VFSPELTEPFAHVLKLLGSKRAFIVHGHDGMDEITVTTTTRISELADGHVKTYEFDPLEFIGQYAKIEDIAGGDPANNAAITRQVLSGEDGPCRDIVCLNAAAALVAGGNAASLKDAWKSAQKSIDSGKALAVLDKLVEITTAG